MASNSNFGENSTVVGDPHYKRLDVDDTTPLKGDRAPSGSRTGKTPSTNAFTSVDYTIEERPFFIPIGKDGVIAALEKLDKQLQDVCPFYRLVLCVLCVRFSFGSLFLVWTDEVVVEEGTYGLDG